MSMGVSDLEGWAKIQDLLALLGAGGLTVGTASLAAYGVFKWLGAKWIEAKFERQLEVYKSEQSQELERLRLKINSVFDRTIRLHSREFEVLPSLWESLLDAHDTVAGVISPFQRTLKVFEIEEEALPEALKETQLSKLQQKQILDEPTPFGRQKLFDDYRQLVALENARERIRTFAIALKRDGIFVQPEIRRSMDRMLNLAGEALQERNMNVESWTGIEDKYERFQAEAPALLETIQDAVSERLWESTKATV